MTSSHASSNCTQRLLAASAPLAAFKPLPNKEIQLKPIQPMSKHVSIPSVACKPLAHFRAELGSAQTSRMCVHRLYHQDLSQPPHQFERSFELRQTFCALFAAESRKRTKPTNESCPKSTFSCHSTYHPAKSSRLRSIESNDPSTQFFAPSVCPPVIPCQPFSGPGAVPWQHLSRSHASPAYPLSCLIYCRSDSFQLKTLVPHQKTLNSRKPRESSCPLILQTPRETTPSTISSVDHQTASSLDNGVMSASPGP